MTQHLSPSEAQVKAQQESVLFLDVREDWECRLSCLPGAMNIPLRQLPGRYSELPREKPIVVYCHHGMRSQQAAALLRNAGFTGVWNLQGGIDAWSRQLDSSIPRY